jgi:hypothetical protein
MALKPDRIEAYTDISFFMNTVAERGGVAVYQTGGVGVSMDDANAVVMYPTGVNASTKPAGLLLNDVVNLDLTRQHINWYRDEVQVGGKVTLLRQGQVTTDMVSSASGVVPTAGSDAYYDAYGHLTTISTDSVKVGTFLSGKDVDGYVKVDINIT